MRRPGRWRRPRRPAKPERQNQDQGFGPTTSGTVNWWGWTPTDTATANGYIAAFNKEYPNIKVNFKLVSIPDWQAALTPALRSESGPDVFDMQPGSYVTKYGSFAQDMTPVITKALGEDWQSKVAPAGISGLTHKNGKLTALSVGAIYSGTLWINKGLFDNHNLKPPTTLDEWDKVCQELKKANQSCFVQSAAGAGFDQDTLQAIANSVEPGFWTKASKSEAKWNEPAMSRRWTSGSSCSAAASCKRAQSVSSSTQTPTTTSSPASTRWS